MNKAFLFDMDGVLVNSETSWHLHGKDFFTNLFGKKIREQMGDIIGMSIDAEYELASQYGFTMERERYYELYDKQAKLIYQKSEITPGTSGLFSHLEAHGFVLGIVTSSRKNWVDMVVPRIPSHDKFSLLFSLNERSDLRPKPHPDGYIEAMKIVGAQPETTIILEDSNFGIAAAKASGATAIGFRQHLIPGYKQIGADFYADTLEDVDALVDKATCSHRI